MVKINYKLLPIKAHYFFFMAAMGPILPFLNVFGKQLGVSEVVMGSVTAILPLLFLVAKPAFGLIADYFRNQRRALFMGLIASGSAFYVLLYFIPQPEELTATYASSFHVNGAHCGLPVCEPWANDESLRCGHTNLTEALCDWFCSPSVEGAIIVSTLLYRLPGSTAFHPLCLLENETLPCGRDVDQTLACNLTCTLDEPESKWECLYWTPTFWGFVVLMSLGTIGFNVTNSISDAICFDVLGSGGEMGYGRQRVWGTLGFGVTAFLAGWLIDWWSGDAVVKDYTPAFILVLVFTLLDLLCCTKLRLPHIPTSKNIINDVIKLIRHRHIAIFLVFAILAGIMDGFIIYYLFWFLEDLAMVTGNMGDIKLLEGCVVAAETLVGEVIYFSISGKLLQKIGYGNSLTLCFLCYAIRLGLISLVSNPWWVVPIELFMQGPTYAMCYTTIVAYASAVSPPGTSATMQGIVAGMDDGFGYAMGSLFGGLLYRWIGGSRTFQLLSAMAGVCSIIHYILYKCYLKKKMVRVEVPTKDHKTPEEALNSTDTAMKEQSLKQDNNEEL